MSFSVADLTAIFQPELRGATHANNLSNPQGKIDSYTSWVLSSTQQEGIFIIVIYIPCKYICFKGEIIG